MREVPKIALRRQTVALIPVLMNVFVMGYASGWLTNAVYFYSFGTELNFSPNEITLIASFYEVGRIVFAIPAGFLTDKYGRKKIVIFAGLTHFLSWLLLSFSTSVMFIYIGRFASGISVAMVNATSLISIGEIASPEIRGKFTSLYTISMVTGATLSGIVSAVFSSYYLLTYNIAAISFVCLVLTFWMMETPSYLISVSKYDQAKCALKQIRPGYSEDDISYEFENLKTYIDEETTRKHQLGWLEFIKSKSIAKPLVAFLLINLFAMLTGYPLIVAYVTIIYPEIGYVSKQYYPLIARIIFLLPLFASPFYIEKFSRRTIFIAGAAVTSVMYVLGAVTNFCYGELGIDFFKWLFIVDDLMLGIIYGSTLKPMNSTMKTELLPQSVKGIGGSLGVIVQAFGLIILYQMYNFITVNLGVYYVYVVLSVNSLILCLLVFFLLPEGRGKFLADIQNEFSGKQLEPVTCKI